MSYTIDHFQRLRERFPSWASLQEYLASPEGGGLRIVQREGNKYAIIRYVKGKSSAEHGEDQSVEVGLFRSVVWDTERNAPVCMAPAKSQAGLPLNRTPVVEDFVDGVMVNVFTEPGAPENIQVATRTVLGGSTGFYSDRTFSEMFDDALAATPLKGREGLGLALNGVVGQVPGAVGAFASFVLQHPQHRVVAKVTTPALYCVHVGTVNESAAIELSERAVNWPQGLARLQVPAYRIDKPFQMEQDIKDFLLKLAVQRGWRWQGLVFKDGLGGRWKLRTAPYQMMRELRGSEATMVARFLRLRAEKKVKEYLTHYGEDRGQMWELENRLRDRTADVYTAYIDVHKAHAVAFKELPAAYKPAVYLLHLKWRDELRGRGFKVRLQNAAEVVNALKPFEQERLMEAEPYVAVAAAAAAAAEPTASAEPTSAVEEAGTEAVPEPAAE